MRKEEFEWWRKGGAPPELLFGLSTSSEEPEDEPATSE